MRNSRSYTDSERTGKLLPWYSKRTVTRIVKRNRKSRQKVARSKLPLPKRERHRRRRPTPAAKTKNPSRSPLNLSNPPRRRRPRSRLLVLSLIATRRTSRRQSSNPAIIRQERSR